MAKIVCQECTARCCEAVKRLPYLGETDNRLFATLLLGAVGDCEEFSSQRPRRPFVMEWIIPGEASSCPAFGTDLLCSIHPYRPLACRRFPLTSGGGYHPFCPHPEEIGGEPHLAVKYEKGLPALDAHLLNLMSAKGEEAAAAFIGEESLSRAPVLYNGYFLASLLLAGADPHAAIAGQRTVIKRYAAAGMDRITFLIPDTELAMTAETEGLLANLDWLEARISNWNMAGELRGSMKRALGIELG